jgi:putative transposase
MEEKEARRPWEIADELWAEIEPLLPPGKPHPLGCHHSRGDNRRALQAMGFVLRTGCPWNALNATGIGSSSWAHRRFQEGGQAGVFSPMGVNGWFDYDAWCGIEGDWQAMDGAMTKAPLGGEKTGPHSTDRAKRGTKRRLLTDGGGVPLGVAGAGANRHDFKRARATWESGPIPRPAPPEEAAQGLCLDAGYDYPEIGALAVEFGYTAPIRPRGHEAQAIKREAGYTARRWVVERTHSWLNRFRRILIRWEKKPENYLAMLHLACALVTYRAAGLPG